MKNKKRLFELLIILKGLFSWMTVTIYIDLFHTLLPKFRWRFFHYFFKSLTKISRIFVTNFPCDFGNAITFSYKFLSLFYPSSFNESSWCLINKSFDFSCYLTIGY